MPEQTVSILAILKDQFSPQLSALQKGLGSFGESLTKLKEQVSKPFEGFKERINEIKEGFGELQEKLEPLTGKTAEFIAGFFSFELIAKSLEEATKAKKAEAELFTALQSDQERFEEIEKAAIGIADNSSFAADQLIKSAQILASRGVEFSELPKALKLSADLAAQLGESAEQGAEQIAQVYGGRIPRELLQVVPSLQTVRGQVDSTGKAIAILSVQVSGAAERYAKTDIGIIEKAHNDLNRSYEAFGKVLLGIEAKVLPSVISAFKKFLDQLSSPAGQVFIQGITDILMVIVKAIPYILEFYTALTAWRLAVYVVGLLTTAIDLLATSLLFLVSPLGLVLVGLALVVAGIAVFTTQTENGQKAAKSFGDTIRETWKDLQNGTLTLSDIYESVVSTLKIIGIRWQEYIYEIPVGFIKGLWNYIVDISIAVEKTFVSMGYSISNGIANAFSVVLREIGKEIDTLAGKAADLADSAFPGSGNYLRTNVASRMPTGASAEALANAKKAADEASAARGAISGSTILDPDKVATSKADFQVQKETDRYNDLIKAVHGADDAKHGLTENDSKRAADAAKNQQKILEAAFASIENYDSDKLSKAKAELGLASLKESYDQRRIVVEDYIKQKDELETRSATKELEEQTAVVERLKKQKEEEQEGGKAASSQTLGALNLAEEKRLELELALQTIKQKQGETDRQLLQTDHDRTNELNQQIQLARLRSTGNPDDAAQADILAFKIQQQNELNKLQRENRTEEELSDLRQVQAAQLREKINEENLKLAERMATEAEAEFKTAMESTQLKLKSGAISPFQAQTEEVNAIAQFKKESEESIVLMKQLLTTVTDPKAIQQLQLKIQEAQTKQQEALAKTKTEVEKASEEIGKTLQGPLSGFFDSLITHTKTVKEAFADMVKSIGASFAKLASDAAANAIIKTLFGGGDKDGGGSGIIGGLIGGLFNTGGIVPGGGPDQDSVLAYLTPGEGVVRRTAIRHYGEAAIHAMNSLSIPRDALIGYGGVGRANISLGMNSGGIVPAGAVAGGGIQEAVVAPTQENFHRMIKGGHRALWDAMAEHRSEARAALGIDG